MDVYERVVSALKLEPVDRQPAAAFCTAVSATMMKWAGEDFASARESPERYARLASGPWEVYGIENVKIPFDMTVEPELFGAEINFGNGQVLPQVRRHAFAHAEDFAIPRDWQDRGRVPFMRRVFSILKERYEGHVPICHLCDGPFTLANMIFGFENLLTWSVTEPGAYARAMEGVTGFCIEYCRMLEDEGVDIIQFGEAAASGDLISGGQYEKLVAPYHARLAEAVTAPNLVHICGNITGHFPALSKTGLGGISFDQKADAREAVKHCKGKMTVIGYVPIPILNEGTPEQVAASARECLETGVDVLHAGCAWPPTVPDENAKAFVRTAHAYNY